MIELTKLEQLEAELFVAKLTQLERLQKNVAETKANYDAAAKVVDAAFAFLDAAAADPAYYLADVAAHNAWDAADTKYAAWAKARLEITEEIGYNAN